MMTEFLKLCQDIGCPVSEEKTEWGCEFIIFLGTLLDGNQHCLVISEEKKNKAIQQLNSMVHKKKVQVKDLQSLTGLLIFLTRAIVPGRAFTRRLFAKIPSFIYTMQQKKLKFYHHVTMDVEFRNDCAMWLTFLKNANDNKALLCRPFIDFEDTMTTAEELQFFTDASKKETYGFGAVYGNHWTFGVWEKDFIRTHDPSIEYLELFALCIGIFSWGNELANRRVIVHCDNQAVVQMINNTTSSCVNCMYLIRMLVLDGIMYNRRLFAKYIKSGDNILADALSRQQLKRFWDNASMTMDPYPGKLPEEIWPMSRIWQENKIN